MLFPPVCGFFWLLFVFSWFLGVFSECECPKRQNLNLSAHSQPFSPSPGHGEGSTDTQLCHGMQSDFFEQQQQLRNAKAWL